MSEDPDPTPPLGAELRERREARGWSQADVGNRLDVTHNAVAAWENNHCGASDEHAAALVALLGTSDRRLSLVERRRRDQLSDLHDEVLPSEE